MQVLFPIKTNPNNIINYLEILHKITKKLLPVSELNELFNMQEVKI
jgi:hypothetical protein